MVNNEFQKDYPNKKVSSKRQKWQGNAIDFANRMSWHVRDITFERTGRAESNRTWMLDELTRKRLLRKCCVRPWLANICSLFEVFENTYTKGLYKRILKLFPVFPISYGYLNASISWDTPKTIL